MQRRYPLLDTPPPIPQFRAVTAFTFTPIQGFMLLVITLDHQL